MPARASNLAKGRRAGGIQQAIGCQTTQTSTTVRGAQGIGEQGGAVTIDGTTTQYATAAGLNEAEAKTAEGDGAAASGKGAGTSYARIAVERYRAGAGIEAATTSL